MTQQTAVEWFYEQLYGTPRTIWEEELNQIREQAKAMEKEQIINAHSQGLFGEESNPPTSGYSEQYYNETYNK